MLDYSILLERFETKYIPEPNSGCWLWTGAINSQRRGSFGIPKLRKTISAHRLSYLLFKGSIPNGLQIRHNCDVPICVNPDHLLLGTQRDNMADRKQRGRTPMGWLHPKTKLSLEQIAAIIVDPRLQQEIADEYGIHNSYVSQLKNGKRVRAC